VEKRRQGNVLVHWKARLHHFDPVNDLLHFGVDPRGLRLQDRLRAVRYAKGDFHLCPKDEALQPPHWRGATEGGTTRPCHRSYTLVADPKSATPSLTFRFGTSIFSRIGLPEAGQTLLP
jgi:hypothetical protein